MRIPLALAACLVTLAGAVTAATPTAVPYLGYLLYDSGGPVNGVISVTVQVHSEPIDGASLWGPHTFSNVAVQDGLFTVLLGGGSSPDLAPALDSGNALWLAFTIDGTPLEPRQRILSVPFARRAQDASHLGGQPAQSYAVVASLPSVALSGSFDDLLDVPETLLQGSGASGAIPQFGANSTLSASALSQAGGKVGVNEPNPQSALHVGGGLTLGMDSGECTGPRAGTLRWSGSAVEVCDGTSWQALGASSGSGPGGPGIFNFTSHTFTPCGQTGRSGPTLSQCQSAYNQPEASAWKGVAAYYDVQAGIQRWTVPIAGTYRITAAGAQGGPGSSGNAAGRGARMAGTFVLTAGEQLKILVGQQGGTGTVTGNGGSGGGGGGTFVTTSSNTILVIAGGGAGTTYVNCGAASQPGPGVASTSTERAYRSPSDSNPEVDGPNGGVVGGGGSYSNPSGGGGAGFSANGGVSSEFGTGNFGDPALSFVNGGIGGGTYPGRPGVVGGFGGGGSGNGQPGGGGGYGGGSQAPNWCWSGGVPFTAGGSSINNGSDQANVGDNNTGPGYVTIEKL